MRIFILTILVSFLGSCGNQEVAAPISAKAAFEAYVEALNNGDLETAAAFYSLADGFHWIERGGVQYETGADAARALTALSATGGRSHMSLDNMRLAELTGDSALLSTHFEYTMFTEAGETQFSFDGWMTVGMVRGKDGWKIAGGQTGPGRSE